MLAQLRKPFGIAPSALRLEVLATDLLTDFLEGRLPPLLSPTDVHRVPPETGSHRRRPLLELHTEYFLREPFITKHPRQFLARERSNIGRAGKSIALIHCSSDAVQIQA